MIAVRQIELPLKYIKPSRNDHSSGLPLLQYTGKFLCILSNYCRITNARCDVDAITTFRTAFLATKFKKYTHTHKLRSSNAQARARFVLRCSKTARSARICWQQHNKYAVAHIITVEHKSSTLSTQKGTNNTHTKKEGVPTRSQHIK